MRAFILSMVFLVAVSAVAAFALDSLEWTAGKAYTSSTGSVRN